MDFVSERLTDGSWFRILTIVDQYTRECLCMHADRSQTGEKVAEQLDRLIAHRGAPESITSDNGSEFTGPGSLGASSRRETKFYSSWQTR
jgi:putative transposase